MPTAAPRPCQRPACASYAVEGSGYCATHRPAEKAAQYRADNAARPNSNAQGYNHRWRKARLTWLARHPVCVGHGVTRDQCGQPATVVDHIMPHKGDQALFWDAHGNWQSLCKTCHDRKTGSEQAIISNVRPGSHGRNG